jgi:hypothetical protein
MKRYGTGSEIVAIGLSNRVSRQEKATNGAAFENTGLEEQQLGLFWKIQAQKKQQLGADIEIQCTKSSSWALILSSHVGKSSSGGLIMKRQSQKEQH